MTLRLADRGDLIEAGGFMIIVPLYGIALGQDTGGTGRGGTYIWLLAREQDFDSYE